MTPRYAEWLLQLSLRDLALAQLAGIAVVLVLAAALVCWQSPLKWRGRLLGGAWLLTMALYYGSLALLVRAQ